MVGTARGRGWNEFGRWGASLLMSALGAAGCGGDDPARSRVPGGDAAVDVEAGVDATVDGALDGGVDGDSGADATLDASNDAPSEASDDAAADSSEDAASDGSDDAAADGGGDAAEPDAGDASELDASDAETGVDGGDGGLLVCTPGHTEPCYSGPAGTVGVGACKAGISVCLTDGSGYGACFGEVTPVAETCATAVDDDCDGEVNEEGDFCVCSPGHTIECYTGPAGTVGVGLCSPGVRSCNTLGSGYGACQGETLPATESCATHFDEDCDRVPECAGDVKTVTTLGLGPGDELLAVDNLWGKRTGVAVRRGGLTGSNEVIDFLEGGGMQARYVFPAEAVPTSMWSDESYLSVAGVYSGAPDLGTGPLPQATSGLFAVRQHTVGHSYWVAGRAATFWMPATVWATVVNFVGEPMAILSNATAIDFGSGLQATNGPTIVYERLLLPYDYPPRPLKLAGTGTVTALTLNMNDQSLVVSGTVSGTADLGTGPLTNGAFMVSILPSTGVAKLLKFAPLHGVVPAKHHPWLPMLVGLANAPHDYGTGVLPAGMIVLPFYTDGVVPWARSIPGCTPLNAAGSQLMESVVFVIAQCTASVDLGSGLVPPGRVLFRFTADPGQQWARPLPANGWDPAYVVNDFPSYIHATGVQLIGVASTPLDFGTGPVVYGSSVFVAHSVPWQ